MILNDINFFQEAIHIDSMKVTFGISGMRIHLDNLSVWLVRFAFLLSVFSFSGYVGNSDPQKQTTQTELLLSSPSRTRQSTPSYYDKLEHFSAPNYPTSKPNSAHGLSAYNILVQVQLERLSFLYRHIKPYLPLVRLNQFLKDQNRIASRLT